ncbi:iron-sulfur cluster carrier protein ApbC [Pseudidiomarina insulisalsae]|uniref:Iron-sulfur cluster carrier protein n=1 Tax=Pseudidiomarina insulisalsae TaxID=575789 RepID=A0A432YGY6_9GAMM|nr:iron-sulfur cluster carrier protein ApbC [Pseudidiomarina insulisalsae]RUO60227.1 iron-sulfur cluster carrier protein ApbC [Pseudidiomarina insulisalsae]
MIGKWWPRKTSEKSTAPAGSSALPAQLASAVAQFRLPGWSTAVPQHWWQLEGQQLQLKLPFAATDAVLAPLRDMPQLNDYQISLRCTIEKLPNSQPDLPLVYGNVIVVSSGKGGVGKSSVAVQLALGLAESGAKVGLLDADVYGPSLPTMLGGSAEKQGINAQNKMEPHLRHGVYVSSLGYLADAKDAAIWRGPMASAALQQLFKDTQWPRLDYLIIDMPPGTGDIQLTIAQKIPVTGAVVVTTPQNVALADAEKGIAMFRKVGIPITGLIENMSYFKCSACGHLDPVFGSEGGVRVASEHEVPLLAQLPLASKIRQALDEGEPLLVSAPQHELNQPVRDMAVAVAGQLYQQANKHQRAG